MCAKWQCLYLHWLPPDLLNSWHTSTVSIPVRQRKGGCEAIRVVGGRLLEQRSNLCFHDCLLGRSGSGNGNCPPSEGFVVKGSINRSPIKGALVCSLASVRHIIARPSCPFEVSTCPCDGSGVCHEVGCLFRKTGCQHSYQHGIALCPESQVGYQASSWSLRPATALCLLLQPPGFRQQLPHVYILQVPYLPQQLWWDCCPDWDVRRQLAIRERC